MEQYKLGKMEQRFTKSRIKNVLNYKKPAFWIITVSIVAVVAVFLGLMSNPKDATNAPFASSAKDILNRYTLALAASDVTEMRRLTPTLNPPPQEVSDIFKQIKIASVEVLKEDIRENKAVFELSVTVKEAPNGFGMWTPGTATHFLYVEKCDNGWYVESYGAGGRSQNDLDAWWNQPNLIGGAITAKHQAPSAKNLWSTRATYVGDNKAFPWQSQPFQEYHQCLCRQIPFSQTTYWRQQIFAYGSNPEEPIHLI